jgi:hypothetical protein
MTPRVDTNEPRIRRISMDNENETATPETLPDNLAGFCKQAVSTRSPGANVSD